MRVCRICISTNNKYVQISWYDYAWGDSQRNFALQHLIKILNLKLLFLIFTYEDYVTMRVQG